MVTKDNNFSQKRVMRKWGYPYKSPDFSHTFSNAIYLIIFISVYVIYKKKLIRLAIQSSISNALVLPAHNWCYTKIFFYRSIYLHRFENINNYTVLILEIWSELMQAEKRDYWRHSFKEKCDDFPFNLSIKNEKENII